VPSLRRVWLWLLLASVIVTAGAYRLYRTAVLGSGFMAQLLCSGTFVSHRDPVAVLTEDMTGPGYSLLRFFQPHVEREAKRVTASMHGLGTKIAIFREGLGCTLLVDRTEDELRRQTAGISLLPRAPNPDLLWPIGERVELGTLPHGVDQVALAAAIKDAFEEPHKPHPRSTRALVIVYHGQIVAERYATGFDATMPLIGWSMTKMALNALVGAAVQEGKIALADKSLLPEWRSAADPRGEITLDQLLRMTSGLSFSEDYVDHSSDVIQMLFVQGDKASFAAAKPVEHPPGTYWHYSSGSSNIIARVLRERFAYEGDYLRFPRERLFEPLGMRSAVLEPDEAGNFVGSTFMYASARDWARLGLLFLHDGVWQGRRLLPEGWLVYSLTPTKGVPSADYGAHVWLKLPETKQPSETAMPEGAYFMLGYDEQVVAIVPSRDLVIVRLGLSRDKNSWVTARDLAPLVQAFPPHS
jgi:CubicO group peptidase (beta-lactamase class C family)